MKSEILLGDTVKCKYSGIKGIVTSKTEFINNCIQFGITRKINPKEPSSLEAGIEINIDKESLVLVKKGERHKKDKEPKENTGGRMRIIDRRRRIIDRRRIRI